MKKVLGLTLAILLVSSLASCNNQGNDKETSTSSDNSYSVIAEPPTQGSTPAETTPSATTPAPVDTTTTPPETSAPVTFTSVDMTIYVKLDNVNIRNAPEVNDSTLVATAHYGDDFKCTGKSESWYRIIYGDKVCYISASGITTDNITGNNFTAVNEMVYITTDTATVRRGPSVDTDAVGYLKKGDSLIRVGISESWSKVSYNGKEYYISNSILSTTPVS